MTANYSHAVITSSNNSYLLRVSSPRGVDIKVLDEQRRQQTRTSCDVALSVENEIIPAHTTVLARNSSYFKQHFSAEARNQESTNAMTSGNYKRMIMKHKSLDLVEPFSPMSPPAAKLRKTTSSCLPERSSATNQDPLPTRKFLSSNIFANAFEKTDFSEKVYKPKNNKVLSLPGIKLKGFLEILNFMYTSELRIVEENVHDIAIASNLLQIPMAFEACRLVLLREPRWRTTKCNIPLKTTSAGVTRRFSTYTLHKPEKRIPQRSKELSEKCEDIKCDMNSLNGKAENEELANSLSKFTSFERNAINLSQGLKDTKPAEVNRRSSERKFSRSPKHKILDGNTNSLQAPRSIKKMCLSNNFSSEKPSNLLSEDSMKKDSESNGDCDVILDLRQKPKRKDHCSAREVTSLNTKNHEPELQRLEAEVRLRSHSLLRPEERTATPKIQQWQQSSYAEAMSKKIQHLQSQGSLATFPSLTTSLTIPSPVSAVLIQPSSQIHLDSYRPQISCNALTLDQHSYAAFASDRLFRANSLSKYHATAAELVNSLSLPVSTPMNIVHKQVHTTRSPFPLLPFISKFQSTPVLSAHRSPFLCDQRSTFSVLPQIYESDGRAYNPIGEDKPIVYQRNASPTYNKDSHVAQKDALNSNYMHAKESNAVQDSGTDTDSLRPASVDSGLDTDHNKNIQPCSNTVDEMSSRASVSKAIGIIAATRMDRVSSLTRCDDMRLKDAVRPWVM